MAKDTVIKVSLLLSVFPLTLSNASDRILCFKNDTLLETAGDVILNVFADVNYGQYCNESSTKGLQQISTALYVLQTLNEHNYVPGQRLGLKVLDTCHDEVQVFKRVLRATVDEDCAPHHELGILVPSTYNATLDPLRDYGGSPPIVTYAEQNLTLPLIDILAHYLSTTYENVDLALANTDHVLERFLRISKEAGVCVKRVGHDDNNNNNDANVTGAVIVAIGEASDIRRWLRRGEEPKGLGTKTWFLLPLDNSSIDGYDIFLLIALFVTCCFITRIERNYHEGKCFFGTAVGLLVIWAIWLICFVLMQPENRDAVVSFGVIGTAYSIILGTLTPRIYYMVMHPPGRKNLGRKLDLVDLSADSTVGTTIRQSQLSYDYAHSAQERQVVRALSTYPNYYGSPSSRSKCPDRYRSPIQHEMPGYSNYGFHAEMMEIEIARAAAQARVQNAEAWRNSRASPNDMVYAQPKICRAWRVVLEEERKPEITCDMGDYSPTPTPRNKLYPMRYASPTVVRLQDRIDEENEDEDEEDDEDDQQDEGISRITRF